MVLAFSARISAAVLAIGLACGKGAVAIVDFARDLPLVGGEASAAGAEVETAVSVDADISQSTARMDAAQDWAQNGDMPGGQPDPDNERADKATFTTTFDRPIDGSFKPFTFAWPPDLEQ